MGKKYLSLEEAAQLLAIDPAELNRIREAGEIRAFADRGAWKFRDDDLAELQRQRMPDSSPDLQLAPPLGGDESVVFGDEELTDQPTIVRKGPAPIPGGIDLNQSDSDVRLVMPAPSSDSDVKLVLPDDDDALSEPDRGPGSSDSNVRLVSGGSSRIKRATDSNIRLVRGTQPGGSSFKLPGKPEQADSDVKVVTPKAASADDSDVKVVTPKSAKGSDSDVKVVTPKADSDSDVQSLGDSDSDVKLVAPKPGSDSDVKVVAPADDGSDSDVKLVESGDTADDDIFSEPEAPSKEPSSAMLKGSSGIFGRRTSDSGIRLDTHEPDVLKMPASGLSLHSNEDSVLDEGPGSEYALGEESGINLSAADSGIALDSGDSGLSLADEDSGLTLDSGDSGLALDSAGSGIALGGDSGLTLAGDDSGIALGGSSKVKGGRSGARKGPGSGKGKRPAGDDLGGTIPMMPAMRSPSSSDELAATTMEVPSLGDDADSDYTMKTQEMDSSVSNVIMLDDEEPADQHGATMVRKKSPAESAGVFDLDEEISDDSAVEVAAEDVIGEDDEVAEDVFGAADEDFEAAPEEETEDYGAPVITRTAPADVEWSGGIFAGLAVATLLMIFTGLAVFDLSQGVYYGNARPPGAVLNALKGMFG